MERQTKKLLKQCLLGFLLTGIPTASLATIKIYNLVRNEEILREVLASNSKLMFSIIMGGFMGITGGICGILLMCWFVILTGSYKIPHNEDRAY